MLWKEIILIIVMVVISLLLFYAIQTYILPKVKIKKGYMLISMVVFIALPSILIKFNLYGSKITQYALMLGVSLSMLIYIELVRVDKEKKNRPVVGRPKPKKVNMQDTNNKK